MKIRLIACFVSSLPKQLNLYLYIYIYLYIFLNIFNTKHHIFNTKHQQKHHIFNIVFVFFLVILAK